ncbi:MAG: hypothetical protein IJ272_05775 [Clostridia bacterium]|nr:hypothetical protein [Clostridia bacterium]
MKLYAGFVLTNGEIEVHAVNTRDFMHMAIPWNAIGGIVIDPKEMMKSMTFATGNIKFPPITYFGTRADSKGVMVKTRAGTLIELPVSAKLIDV